MATFLLADSFLICSPAISFSTVEKDASWHISALKVSYDNLKQLYIAEGDVVITGETTKLKADYVEFSNITRDALASGNVLLISGQDSVTCDRLQLNLETERGTIYNGTIFINENHFYIKGDTIEKSGKETYHADRASVTSCDGENPDWKLSGKDIKITIDGYGTAKDATLWAGTIPALYSPVVLFPAKTKRQTGLLTPRLSSSNRKGARVEQPVFLAISRGTDATLYTDFMGERGVKTGLEYRYILSGENYGTIFYDYLNDNKIDDGTTASEDYSFASTPTRGNSDRYWFRMKNSHTFDNIWNVRVDIDYVSDADYLHEFKDGFTGFNTVSKYFGDTFGRSIDEYDDITRENSLNINRTWSGSSLNIGAQWFDNVVARQTDTKDTTLQRLPSVELNTVRQQLGKTSLYYDLDSEYRYFYRQDNIGSQDQSGISGRFFEQGTSGSFDIQDSLESIYRNSNSRSLLSGHRADISPRVYMPLKLGAFYLEPSAGVRQSIWYVDSPDDYPANDKYVTAQSPINQNSTDQNSIRRSELDNSTGMDYFNSENMSQLGSEVNRNFNHREIMDFSLELSTKLSKVFDTDNGFAQKVKHEILPTVKYSFTPDVSQDKLPYFDGLDYIAQDNIITWSLANRLTSRNKKSVSTSVRDGSGNLKDSNMKKKQNSNEDYGDPFIYREFAWMEISQSYRIDSTESGRSLISGEYYNRGSSLLLEKYFQHEDLSQLKAYQRSGSWFQSDYALDSQSSFKSGNSFSDISAEIEFSPVPFFSLNSDLKWSPYDKCFSSHDSGITIRDKRGDALETWYRYEDSDSLSAESESLFASLNTKLTDSLNLFFACERNLTDNKNIESHTGFYLNKSCWSMRVSYSDTPEDQTFSFIVNLNGIGEFGKK
ncbi:MAG: LPS assembly protein LptD [Desulfamplus sp.]|nr:LPS assembly protein LptD [Desulfamplus sp.]